MRAEHIVRFKTKHCELTIKRPAPALIEVKLSGHDVGELGEAPFVELARDFTLAASPAPASGNLRELFIDARDAQGASIEVSGAWASWLREHKAQLARVHLVSGSRFIQLSADFVRKFAELGETMRIYTDQAAFDEELSIAVDRALSR
jgi:hypothetical protein